MVQYKGVGQVRVLEDDRMTPLVSLQLGAVLLDKSLGVYNPRLFPRVPERRQVSFVHLVALSAMSSWSGLLLL